MPTVSLLKRNAQLAEAREIVAGRSAPFTIPEAADVLGVARDTLNRWRREGRVHYRSVNGVPKPQAVVAASEMRRLLAMPEPPAKRRRDSS